MVEIRRYINYPFNKLVRGVRVILHFLNQMVRRIKKRMRTDRDMWLVIFNVVFFSVIAILAVTLNPSNWLLYLESPMARQFFAVGVLSAAVGIPFLMYVYRRIKAIDKTIGDNEDKRHNELVSAVNKLAQEIKLKREQGGKGGGTVTT